MKRSNETNSSLNLIKSELIDQPFKTVFKATMAFYVAQLVATVAGLAILGLVIGGIVLLCK